MPAAFFLYVAIRRALADASLPADIARYKGRYRRGYEVPAPPACQDEETWPPRSKWEMAPPVGNWAPVTNQGWEARGMEGTRPWGEDGPWHGASVAELKKRRLLGIHAALPPGQRVAPKSLSHARPAPAGRPDIAPFKRAKLKRPPSRSKRARLPMLSGTLELPDRATTFMAYGRGWAHVSKHAVREHKHWVHEGGIAARFCAWPRVSMRGCATNSRTTRTLIDLMATCVDWPA